MLATFGISNVCILHHETSKKHPHRFPGNLITQFDDVSHNGRQWCSAKPSGINQFEFNQFIPEGIAVNSPPVHTRVDQLPTRINNKNIFLTKAIFF